MDRKIPKISTKEDISEDSYLSLPLESYDLEGVLSITQSPERISSLQFLDAETNIQLCGLGRRAETDTLASNQSEYLSQVYKIRESTSERRKNQKSLLQRGFLLSKKERKRNLKENSKTAIAQQPEILSEGVALKRLQDSLDLIHREIQEEISMAESESKDKTSEELEGLNSEDEQTAYVEIVAPTSAEEEATSKDTQLRAVQKPRVSLSSSNIDISHLYEQGIDKPLPLPKLADNSERKIPKFMLSSSIIKPSGTKITRSEEVPIASTSDEGTQLMMKKPVDLETIFLALTNITDTLTNISDAQSNLRLFMDGVVGKLVSIEKRVEDVEVSLNMIKAGVGTLDVDLKTYISKQKIPTPIPSQAGETVAIPPPVVSAAPANIKEEELLSAYKEAYKGSLAQEKYQHLTEQVFAQIMMFGGFHKYFEKMHPECKDIDFHLTAIDVDGGKAGDYAAVDRALERLKSKQHKAAYLPVDPSIPLYPGYVIPQSASTSTASKGDLSIEELFASYANF